MPYDEKTSLVDGVRQDNILYHCISQAFDSVPHSIRKHLFFRIIWVIKHWNMLRRKIMESLTLEVFKPTGHSSEQLPLTESTLSKRGRPGILQTSLPASTFYEILDFLLMFNIRELFVYVIFKYGNV